jgi:hypothetical protein
MSDVTKLLIVSIGRKLRHLQPAALAIYKTG